MTVAHHLTESLPLLFDFIENWPAADMPDEEFLDNLKQLTQANLKKTKAALVNDFAGDQQKAREFIIKNTKVLIGLLVESDMANMVSLVGGAQIESMLQNYF
jgi:hypothetical protein